MKLLAITAIIATVICASLYYLDSTYAQVVVKVPPSENHFKAIILNVNDFDKPKLELLMSEFRKGGMSFICFRDSVEELIKNVDYSLLHADEGDSIASVYCLKGSSCLISFCYESIYIRFFDAGLDHRIEFKVEDLF